MRQGASLAIRSQSPPPRMSRKRKGRAAAPASASQASAQSPVLTENSRQVSSRKRRASSPVDFEPARRTRSRTEDLSNAAEDVMDERSVTHDPILGPDESAALHALVPHPPHAQPGHGVPPPGPFPQQDADWDQVSDLTSPSAVPDSGDEVSRLVMLKPYKQQFDSSSSGRVSTSHSAARADSRTEGHNHAEDAAAHRTVTPSVSEAEVNGWVGQHSQAAHLDIRSVSGSGWTPEATQSEDCTNGGTSKSSNVQPAPNANHQTRAPTIGSGASFDANEGRASNLEPGQVTPTAEQCVPAGSQDEQTLPVSEARPDAPEISFMTYGGPSSRKRTSLSRSSSSPTPGSSFWLSAPLEHRVHFADHQFRGEPSSGELDQDSQEMDEVEATLVAIRPDKHDEPSPPVERPMAELSSVRAVMDGQAATMCDAAGEQPQARTERQNHTEHEGGSRLHDRLKEAVREEQTVEAKRAFAPRDKDAFREAPKMSNEVTLQQTEAPLQANSPVLMLQKTDHRLKPGSHPEDQVSSAVSAKARETGTMGTSAEASEVEVARDCSDGSKETEQASQDDPNSGSESGIDIETRPGLQEAVSTLREPVAAPEELATAPQELATAPQELAIAPQEPATAPQEPATAPQEPATAPQELATAPQEPATVPQEPATAPTDPGATEPVSLQLDGPKGSSRITTFQADGVTPSRETGDIGSNADESLPAEPAAVTEVAPSHEAASSAAPAAASEVSFMIEEADQPEAAVAAPSLEAVPSTAAASSIEVSPSTRNTQPAAAALSSQVNSSQEAGPSSNAAAVLSTEAAHPAEAAPLTAAGSLGEAAPAIKMFASGNTLVGAAASHREMHLVEVSPSTGSRAVVEDIAVSEPHARTAVKETHLPNGAHELAHELAHEPPTHGHGGFEDGGTLEAERTGEPDEERSSEPNEVRAADAIRYESEDAEYAQFVRDPFDANEDGTEGSVESSVAAKNDHGDQQSDGEIGGSERKQPSRYHDMPLVVLSDDESEDEKADPASLAASSAHEGEISSQTQLYTGTNEFSFRRSLLTPARAHTLQPPVLSRRPPFTEGPLARAVARQPPPTSAMARVAAIGARALQQSDTETSRSAADEMTIGGQSASTLTSASPWAPQMTPAPAANQATVVRKAPVRVTGSARMRPSARRHDPILGRARKLKMEAARRSHSAAQLVRLLRTLQPQRQWESQTHHNTIEAILKGARVLRTIDETPTIPAQRLTPRSTQRTDEYYQRKAAEYFLRRERDALSSIGPSEAKKSEYARLRSEREARERRLRGVLGRQPFPARLSDEQEASVQTALQERGLKVSVPGAQVTAHDLGKLRPRQWLNDESINFYGALLMQRSQRAVEKRKEALGAGALKVPMELRAYWDVHFFNSFFYEKVSAQGHKGVARWTRRVDVFAKDKVVFPVNLGNSHWVTGCIDMRNRRIEYYDSMHAPNPHFFLHVRTWLQDEHKAKHGTPLDLAMLGWRDYVNPHFPSQHNGYDCGVFTIATLEQLCRRDPFVPFPPSFGTEAGCVPPPDQPSPGRQEEPDMEFNFSGETMPYLRRRIVYELVHKRLLDSC